MPPIKKPVPFQEPAFCGVATRARTGGLLLRRQPLISIWAIATNTYKNNEKMFRSRNGKTKNADFTVGTMPPRRWSNPYPNLRSRIRFPAVKASGTYAGEKPCSIFAAYRVHGDLHAFFHSLHSIARFFRKSKRKTRCSSSVLRFYSWNCAYFWQNLWTNGEFFNFTTWNFAGTYSNPIKNVI